MDRANYLPAPQFFRLNHACLIIKEAFGDYPYLVGSSITRRDFRDVDVRLILSDEVFDTMFPGHGEASHINPLWSLLCTVLAEWLSHSSDLPIDFQIQRRTQANDKFPSKDGCVRHALGIFLHYPGGR